MFSGKMLLYSSHFVYVFNLCAPALIYHHYCNSEVK